MIRTDLALEAHDIYRTSDNTNDSDGICSETEEKDGLCVTRIHVTNENGEKKLQKPIGAYITIEAPDLKYSLEVYEAVCLQIATELKKMLSLAPEDTVFVVGLGNRDITPDALGPQVMSHLMITRHMKLHMSEYLDEGIAGVCAIAPGVLGTTGIETAEIIRGVVERIKPKAIIAIDALASRSLDRISTTVQLSDTGIAPGAGVGNRRDALNRETLGIPVIAIGVPTVVDAATIVSDSMDSVIADLEATDLPKKQKQTLIQKTLSKNIERLMVTPKDIDLVIERAAKTVANGINLALHKDLTFEEIESFVG